MPEQKCKHENTFPINRVVFGKDIKINAFGGYCKDCETAIVRGVLFPEEKEKS